MKLELNTKEWLAIYGLLERQFPNPDKHLLEIHSRMKAQLTNLIQDSNRDQFEEWFGQTEQKVIDLRNKNSEVMSSLRQVPKHDAKCKCGHVTEQHLTDEKISSILNAAPCQMCDCSDWQPTSEIPVGNKPPLSRLKREKK